MKTEPTSTTSSSSSHYHPSSVFRIVWNVALFLAAACLVWAQYTSRRLSTTATTVLQPWMLQTTGTKVAEAAVHNNNNTNPKRNATPLPQRLQGNLTLPPNLTLSTLPHCVNFQVRGMDHLLTAHEMQDFLFQQQQHQQLSSELHIGMVAVEDPTNFVSLSKGYFHLFHFLEFAVIAFAELHQLSSQSQVQSSTTPLHVAWWYVPLLTQREICGTAAGMNCFILQQLLWPTVTAVYGLEHNPPALQAQHEALRGVLHKRAKVGHVFVSNATPAVHQARYEHMMKQVDALLLVDRVQCKNEQRQRIHKIWTNYLDSFPAHAWYETVQRGMQQYMPSPLVLLGVVNKVIVQEKMDEKHIAPSLATMNTTPPHFNTTQSSSSNQLVVCYIDRQSTNRNLPDAFHSWLLEYLRHHVDLRHLRMERYTAAAQIALAQRDCHALVGVHGNGLSHLLWMRPGSAVLELYWDFGFHYDYASAAQLMGHLYRGLYNGELLDPDRIAARDSKMLSCCTTTFPRQESRWNMTASQAAVRDFVALAWQQRFGGEPS